MSCKCAEFFDQQTNCYLHRKDSALWTGYLVTCDSQLILWDIMYNEAQQMDRLYNDAVQQLDTLYNDLPQLDTLYNDAQQLYTRTMTLNNCTPYIQ